MYYVVILPPDTKAEEEESARDFIFTNVADATKKLKKYTGSRMKSFASEEEALKCASSTENEKQLFEKSLAPLEFSPVPQHDYPSLLPKELACLRRLIEANKCEQVDELIWRNPRYLVTSCDTPVVLMAGPRYNACHIAARRGHADVLDLILKTVSTFRFVRLLNPSDSTDIIKDRVAHILDSYLNTPDPRQGFTPLHSACRNGYVEVIKLLLEYKQTDRTLRDLCKKTARESLLCVQLEDAKDDLDEYKQVLEQKKQIDALFEIRTTIPLYKSASLTPPRHEILKAKQHFLHKQNNDKQEERLEEKQVQCLNA